MSKITYRKCRSISRQDGLKMKCTTEYTFPSLLRAISSRNTDRVAYSVYNKEEEITYDELERDSMSIASFLLNKGFKKGDKLAILAESSPEWMVIYFSITYVGIIAVPILPDFSSSEIDHILSESGATGIAVNEKQYKKVRDVIVNKGLSLVRLEDLTYLDSYPDKEEYNVLDGEKMKDYLINYKALESSKPTEEDIASIIYTSGTTGFSKGVVLTHKNLIVSADEASDVYVKINKGDSVLSILPLSHVYEFTIGNILPLMRGAHITFLGKPPAVTILLKAFKKIRPHIILTVPLLMEKIYKGSIQPLLKDNKLVKTLIGNKVTRKLAYYIIKEKLMAKLGGRIKFFGIGGAALDKEVEEFLFNINFPYAIGYGLTETSPLIAGCGPKKKQHALHKIGEIVKHDEVKLIDVNDKGIGEVAVKGPNVMKGYYNNDELNKEAFTLDGFFKTGDLGELKEGKLALKGRSKTMILTSSGENIYPEPIESIINNMDFVEESLVVAKKGGLVALVKVDLKKMQEKLNSSDILSDVDNYLKELIRVVNSQLSSSSRILDVVLQQNYFQRTPTQKIKRFLYS